MKAFSLMRRATPTTTARTSTSTMTQQRKWNVWTAQKQWDKQINMNAFPGDKLKSQHSYIHCVPFCLYFTMCAILLLLIQIYHPLLVVFTPILTQNYSLWLLLYKLYNICLIKFHKYSNGIFSFGSCLTATTTKKMAKILEIRERERAREKTHFQRNIVNYMPRFFSHINFCCFSCTSLLNCYCYYSFARKKDPLPVLCYLSFFHIFDTSLNEMAQRRKRDGKEES